MTYLASGCSAILYYGYPEERTVEHQRAIAVEVRSAPSGAEITGPGGEILGAAPLRTQETVTVRRTTKMHSMTRAALGCGVDISLVVGAATWNGITLSTASEIAFYASMVPFTGCLALAFTKALNQGVTEPTAQITQSPPILRAPIHTGEEVVSKAVSYSARWPDAPPTSAEVTLPAQRYLTLARPEPKTFDEALILRYRSGYEPGPEGLYRLGHAFRKLSQDGQEDAAGQAVTLFRRYLATDAVPAERRREVESLIAELGPAEATP